MKALSVIFRGRFMLWVMLSSARRRLNAVPAYSVPRSVAVVSTSSLDALATIILSLTSLCHSDRTNGCMSSAAATSFTCTPGNLLNFTEPIAVVGVFFGPALGTTHFQPLG